MKIKIKEGKFERKFKNISSYDVKMYLCKKNIMIYLAFLDILGYSKIVEKNTHEKLIKIFDDAIAAILLGLSQNSLVTINNKTQIDISKIPVHCKIISDSIILWTDDSKEDTLIKLIISTKLIMKYCFQLGLPLRGCLSKGNLTRNNKFVNSQMFDCDVLLGDALVQAYKNEQKQKWSGCVIENECMHGQTIINILSLLGMFTKYNVPYENDEKRENYVINWVHGQNHSYLTEEYVRKKFSEYNKTTNDEVEIKIQNTLDFIKFAKEQTILTSEELVRLFNEQKNKCS